MQTSEYIFVGSFLDLKFNLKWKNIVWIIIINGVILIFNLFIDINAIFNKIKFDKIYFF